MSLLQKSMSVELSRRTQPFYAKKSSYAVGEQVQIEVDTQREFIDPETARIQFDLNVTGGNGDTYPCAASCAIRNLRVKTLSGQMIGHELREYRSMAQWLLKQKTDNGDDDLFNQMEGITVVTINDGLKRQFSHKPLAHIFSLKDYYPAHFHQGLMIEFDLPAASIEMITANAASFTDVRLVVDLVQLKPEIENEMVRLMEEQKLFVDYVEWLSQENDAPTGDYAYDVVGIDGRVKAAFTWEYAAGRLAADYHGHRTQALTLWDTYRFRLGSRYLNYQNIQVGAVTGAAAVVKDAERSYELLKALDLHHKLTDGSGHNNSGENRLVYAVGVKVDKAMSEVDEVISSQVDKDRNNLRVELSRSGAAVAGGTVQTFVVLDKRLQLLPGSIVRSVRS